MISVISSRLGLNQNLVFSRADALPSANGLNVPLNTHSPSNGAAEPTQPGLGNANAYASYAPAANVDGDSTMGNVPGQPLGYSREIRLRTCSLDICKGDFVEIDAGVYEYIWDVLDEVFVGVCDSPYGCSYESLAAAPGGWMWQMTSEGGQGAGCVMPFSVSSPISGRPDPQEVPPGLGNTFVGVEPVFNSCNANDIPRVRHLRKNQLNHAGSRTSPASNSVMKTLPRTKRRSPFNQGNPSRKGRALGEGAYTRESRLRKTARSEKRCRGQDRKTQNEAEPRDIASSRFKIYVEMPHDGQRIELWVHKRHTVRKVLAKLCQSLDINPLMLVFLLLSLIGPLDLWFTMNTSAYRSKLFLFAEEHDIGAGMAIKQVECNKDMTMNQVGVKHESTLALVLDSREDIWMRFEVAKGLDMDTSLEDSYRETKGNFCAATVAGIQGNEDESGYVPEGNSM
ncbi:hypothetical protein AX16_010771 [Volvariella volvacea WC 439]|nr:hypothetical protein AX16_010771 [Volvariella volvacea WC 439]